MQELPKISGTAYRSHVVHPHSRVLSTIRHDLSQYARTIDLQSSGVADRRTFTAFLILFLDGCTEPLAANAGIKWASSPANGPTFCGLHCRTTWPAILARPWQPSFQHQLSGRFLDHVPGNAAKGDFDAALPTGVELSGRLTDINVNEAARRRTLRQRAEEVWQPIVTVVLDRHRELEGEVGVVMNCQPDCQFVRRCCS